MNFDDVSILDRESIWIRRRMKESLHVRKLKPEVPMNKDDGGYELSHVWDPLLRPAPTPSGRQPGGYRGDKPSETLVAYACTKQQQAGVCYRFLHCLMKFAEVWTKDLQVSHLHFLNEQRKIHLKFTLLLQG